MKSWWRNRSLYARLWLLVTAAVAVAVLILAALAWTAVAGIQSHQTHSELEADAAAIAAAPQQWSNSAGARPDPGEGTHEDGHHHHDLGLRWQILDAKAAVLSDSADPLPVTTGARQVALAQTRRVEEDITLGPDSYRMLTVPATGGGAVQVAINQDPAIHTLTTFGLFLLVGSAIGIALAALLGRAVARSGLVPVQRLTQSVEEVAATMDLTRPVEVSGVDEIARLGRVVNTLLGAIETARQAQRALVEDAGHELRTPLTSLRTNIELLLKLDRRPELAHRLPPEERTKLLNDLDAQVSELATLSTELVELAREEGTREPADDLDLSAAVTAAMSRVRMRAPNITFEAEVEPVSVHGRSSELERMVLNVLDNAAKWSSPGAIVKVQLRAAEPGWVTVRVSDTGPGIDESDRPHVFDRFYRAPAARSMAGSGLGLAIVAQTVSQHGGTVIASANQPHGTVITIRLPRVGTLG